MVFYKFPSAQQVLQCGSSSIIIINGTSNVGSANLNIFSVLSIHFVMITLRIEIYPGMGVDAGTEDWSLRKAPSRQMGRGVTDRNT